MNNYHVITGLSHGFHDAAAARVREDGFIHHAIHSERYTGIKNDRNLYPEYIALGKHVFYEKPFRKNLRRLYAGQKWKSRPKADYYIDHHWSHAVGRRTSMCCNRCNR